MNKTEIEKALTPSDEEVRRDGKASWVRSITGIVPYIGTAIGEYYSSTRADWRYERQKNVLIKLEQRVLEIENGLECLTDNVKTEAGADLLEEGIEQAERAITDFRQGILSRVLAGSLTSEELNHEEDHLILSTLRSLSEYELIHFIYQAVKSGEFVFDSDAFKNAHREILIPRQASMSSSQDELNSASAQRQYKAMLAQKGLLEYATTGTADPQFRLSKFGRMFFRRLNIEEN